MRRVFTIALVREFCCRGIKNKTPLFALIPAVILLHLQITSLKAITLTPLDGHEFMPFTASEKDISEDHKAFLGLLNDDVQFQLPGSFLAPFEFLNNIPQAGLDVDSNGTIDIIAPCSCRGGQVIDNGANPNNAYFDSPIIIATGISGQNWQIADVDKVFHPSTLLPLFPGTSIPEIGQTGIYVLPFAHQDASEYQILVEENTAFPGQLFGPVSATCYYPDPFIEALDPIYCDNAEDFILQGSATSDFDGNIFPLTPSSENWIITRQSDGQTFFGPSFSPSAMGGGRYTIRYVFNAGNDAHNTPNNTGCTVTTETEVIVHATGALACNGGVNVTINPVECFVKVVPEILLAGNPETYEFYRVDIVDPVGNLLGDSIPAEFAGNTLPASITDECSGLKCFTTVAVFDYAAPVLDIPGDTLLPCSSAYDPSVTGLAKATDCSDIEISYEDEVSQSLCASPRMQITRTWTATDPFGNASSGVQYISIARGNPDDLLFPEDRIFSCTDYLADPSIADPEPDKAGTPNLVDIDLCGFVYTYEDDTVSVCGNPSTNFIIIRTFLLFDVCGVELIEQDGQGNDNIQFIRVLDDEAPTILADTVEVSAEESSISNGLEECSSIAFIPAPDVSDGCNEWTVKVFTPIGELEYVNGTDASEGGYLPAPGLTLGVHTITYEAEDACGNTSQLTGYVKVLDTTTPIMICDNSIQVILSPGGEGRIFPADIDEGSFDGCCLGDQKVKLAGEPDSLFRDFIEFFCTNDMANVVMRTWDCSGNYNDCQSNVLVEDRVPVQIVSAPGNTMATCLEDYSHFLPETFDAPVFADNCTFTTEYAVEVDLDTCGIGTITRTWIAKDNNTNTPAIVNQTILVEAVHDYSFTVPADIVVSCSTDTFSNINFEARSCDLITVAVQEETYSVAGDSACFRILRTHQLINWCEYDGISAPFKLERYDDGSGSVGDSFTVRSDGTTLFRQILLTIEDDIGISTGYYEYEQLVYVFDEEPPTLTYDTLGVFCTALNPVDTIDPCSGFLAYPFTIGDNCATEFTIFHSILLFNDNVVADGFGELIDLGANQYEIKGNYPVGNHAFLITLFDECGNIAQFSIPFEVADCTAPLLSCKANLSMAIDTSEVLSIIPQDLVEFAGDNCTAPLLSFDSLGLDIMQTYNCDELGNYPLTVWAQDEKDNRSSCQINVEVTDDFGICVKKWLAEGRIEKSNGEGISEVTVQLEGPMNMEYLTDTEGFFNFEEIPEGQLTMIKPIKDFNYTNGVTTLDLIKISRHILAVKPLTDPYELIAADANRSGSINTIDIIKLRKLILNIDTALTNNTSWRFVPANYEFLNPQNPFVENFPEEALIESLSGDTIINFVGIKVGDVNNSAITTDSEELVIRSEQADLFLDLENRSFEAGEEFEVPIVIEDEDVIGFQFALRVDPESIKIQEIFPEQGMEMNHFGFSYVEEGILIASWDRKQKSEKPKFRLRLKALTKNTLEHSISITPGYLKSEAYKKSPSQDIDIHHLGLRFQSVTSHNNFSLLQNRPNPFKRFTTFPLIMPQAGPVEITLFNLQGRVVSTFSMEMEEGYQTFIINEHQLNQAGLWHVQVKTPYGSAIRKILFLKN